MTPVQEEGVGVSPRRVQVWSEATGFMRIKSTGKRVRPDYDPRTVSAPIMALTSARVGKKYPAYIAKKALCRQVRCIKSSKKRGQQFHLFDQGVETDEILGAEDVLLVKRA